MKKQPIYLLDPKLKWKIFKELQDKFVKDSGPVPVHGDKILWGMNKKGLIYCWFDPYVKDDMKLGLKLPKNRDVKIITNPKNLCQKKQNPTNANTATKTIKNFQK